ncbi:MAG: hypothetical protein ORN20_07005, partial [Candidatus Nanopelagicales bacterium]|nr:hypothetical protein [Candidatus Nanopelagicales bacterium]
MSTMQATNSGRAHLPALRTDLERVRTILDRTDAVLGVADDALGKAEHASQLLHESAREARKWGPVLVVVVGVAAIGVVGAIIWRNQRDQRNRQR